MLRGRRLRNLRDVQISGAAFLAALSLVVLLASMGLTQRIEGELRDFRDTLRIAPASGEVVIVEVDGRSLQEIDEWPWPRRHYASAVAELDRLGAEQIAFDIDFSSHSTRAEDQSFAETLRSIDQPVILPTFRQANLSGGNTVVSEALPIEELRDNAFLASVNVTSSANGEITLYSNGEVTDGIARPSLANMIARTGGAIDQKFRIDQAIDPATIPRISFIDLLEKRVSADEVAGKRVVFGATAIELGDRYPTALFGVQSGVVIQVQAAETLLQGRARETANQWFVLSGVASLLALIMLLRTRRENPRFGPITWSVAIGFASAVIAIALDLASLTYIPLAAIGVLIAAFALIHRGLSAAVDLETERLTHTASGLPNRTALELALRKQSDPVLAVARMADFGEIVTVLDTEQLARLDRDIARRLRLLAGAEDVYRLDTGVFGWIMPKEKCDHTEEAFDPARAIFNAPFFLDGERYRIQASYGCVAGTIGEAMNAAELAFSRGLIWSDNGKDVHEDAQFRQRLLGELDDALESGAISVVYQPKLKLADKVISSAECLVRWNSPKLGRISPEDFIPILEEKERIADLTRFVLKVALDRRAVALALGHPINLAVNVSAQLLEDAGFVEQTLAMLRDAELDVSGGLTLEITESAPLEDSSAAREALEAFGKAGARVSIDDYGTGQATLNYLQGFPAHELKLDQSFVRGLVHNQKDRIMVQSTVELAHALGFEVVAEGVEDQATLTALEALGCDYCQGWAIAKPMPWGEFSELLSGKSQRVAA